MTVNTIAECFRTDCNILGDKKILKELFLLFGVACIDTDDALISDIYYRMIVSLKSLIYYNICVIAVLKLKMTDAQIYCKLHYKSKEWSKKGKGKGHPCTDTEALYRP